VTRVMRRRISDIRKTIRSREKEFSLLSCDNWIRINSEIEAQRLHALGVVTFRWNVCENKLFALFWTPLDLPNEEAQVISHDMNLTDVTTRVRALASIKLKKDKKLIAAIKNGLQVFERCRTNRNQLTHFTFVLARESETGPFRLALARTSRKPEYRERVQFADSITDIRRVARDIRQLNAFLRTLERRAAAKIRPRRKIKLKDWPFPRPLPPPELLLAPNRVK
jgi:hypothetical protein